jgi:hypothetical protein
MTLNQLFQLKNRVVSGRIKQFELSRIIGNDVSYTCYNQLPGYDSSDKAALLIKKWSGECIDLEPAKYQFTKSHIRVIDLMKQGWILLKFREGKKCPWLQSGDQKIRINSKTLDDLIEVGYVCHLTGKYPAKYILTKEGNAFRAEGCGADGS